MRPKFAECVPCSKLDWGIEDNGTIWLIGKAVKNGDCALKHG